MTKPQDKAAREKMVRARTNLLVSNGFFGFLAMQLRLVEAPEMPTMAVDGVSLFYSPEFVHRLSERECEGVEAHEVMHCCFQHFTRRGHRDALWWNIAGDYVINLDLIDAGFSLPGKPINAAQLMDKNHKEKGYMLDRKFKGMNTEDVYEMLTKDLTKVEVSDGSMGGKGSGKPEAAPDPGGCGGVIDAPGDGTQQQNTQQTWETAVRTAVSVAQANNAGQIPGALKNLINNLKRPKVSWRDMTRRFIDQSMTKDVSWSRISRRSTSIGTLMPGYVSDRLHQLVMINDTSGSVSHKMSVEMVSEAGGALDEGTADHLTVIYADTDVQHVDEYVTGDVVKCGHYTGGGTAFSNSFKWVKANAPEASCIIYLTDLQVYDFGEDPGIPVLWAVYGPSSSYEQLAERVPFGTCIHVSTME